MRDLKKFAVFLIAASFAIVLSPVILLFILGHLLRQCALFVLWQFRHGRHGRRWLAVYSDGEKWKHHFERVVLAKLNDSAVVVNISQTPSWKNARSLERQIHRVWGGRRSHTPILIRLPRSLGKVQRVRLYDAYMAAAKRGDESELEEQLLRICALTQQG